MLTKTQKEKLKANWGEKAEGLGCKAEVRVYDPLSSWECFIYAMNPQDEDMISCLINGFTLEIIEEWSMSQLTKLYNREGEHPIVDTEFRPKSVYQIFKQFRAL